MCTVATEIIKKRCVRHHHFFHTKSFHIAVLNLRLSANSSFNTSFQLSNHFSLLFWWNLIFPSSVWTRHWTPKALSLVLKRKHPKLSSSSSLFSSRCSFVSCQRTEVARASWHHYYSSPTNSTSPRGCLVLRGASRGSLVGGEGRRADVTQITWGSPPRRRSFSYERWRLRGQKSKPWTRN